MPIDHIVVLMMENNGFDRMLGWMGGAGRDVDGVDPAHPRSNPDDMDGGDVVQGETRTRNIQRDPLHYLANSLAQLDGGTNQGFVTDYVRTHPASTPEERREIMGWYPRGFLPALHTLAEHGVVFDRWFASHARADLDEPAVRPYRHHPGACRGTGQPVQSQPASLRRAHALRRADRCRRAVADLFRRRSAIAGADASVASPGQLPGIQALGCGCQGGQSAGLQLYRADVFRPAPERPASAARRDARRCADRRRSTIRFAPTRRCSSGRC